MPIPSLPGGLTPQGLPEMPDVSLVIDGVQEGINEIDLPKPPGIAAVGNFFIGSINMFSQLLMGVNVLPEIPSPPSPPTSNKPKVAQVPKTAAPFKMPL